MLARVLHVLADQIQSKVVGLQWGYYIRHAFDYGYMFRLLYDILAAPNNCHQPSTCLLCAAAYPKSKAYICSPALLLILLCAATKC
jgi:hypothetical protein